MKKVITYGTYDLFHQGHYNLLKRAKELGDYLIVGVTSDYFDKSRGKFNVHDSLMTRIENVKATGFADQIVVEEYFGQKIDDIKKYDVDIFTVGFDWKGHFDYLNEYCKVVYLERTKGISSTQIRNSHSIRLGIVGDEQILDRFLSELNYVSGIEPVGGFAADKDVSAVYKSTAAKEFTQYSTTDSLLSAVDAVYINVPLKVRPHYIKAALLQGKHVLTEFPFCSNYESAKELIDLALQKKLVLNEGLKTAYCPAFGKLISLVKSGQIGKVVSIEANFTQILGDNLRNQIRIAGGSMLSLGAYPLERECIHLRNLTDRITKYTGVHIMFHRICGNHNITNINFRIQRACNPRVDNHIHMKLIYKDLCTDRRIDLADATPYNNNLFAGKFPSTKRKGGNLGCFFYFHILFQLCNFIFHCPDNSYHGFDLLFCYYLQHPARMRTRRTHSAPVPLPTELRLLMWVG